MTPDQIYRVARRGNDAVNRVRLSIGAQALARWRQVGNVDDAAALAFVQVVVPIIGSAQATAVAATRAYLGAAIGEQVDVDVDRALATRGVDPAEVYRRPVVVARTALAEGRSWAEAMRLAGDRVVQLAETDVALAARDASRQVLQGSSRVVGYRRVTDGQACPLCNLAATQRYHVEQLMPIHGRCGCTVAPIVGAADPGRIIDRQALAKLKADGVLDERSLQRRVAEADDVVASYRDRAAHWRREAATTTDQQAETRYAKRADEWAAKADARAAELAQDRERLAAVRSGRLERLTAVHEHGELGPTLTDAGHAFTGPAGIAA